MVSFRSTNNSGESKKKETTDDLLDRIFREFCIGK